MTNEEARTYIINQGYKLDIPEAAEKIRSNKSSSPSYTEYKNHGIDGDGNWIGYESDTKCISQELYELVKG